MSQHAPSLPLLLLLLLCAAAAQGTLLEPKGPAPEDTDSKGVIFKMKHAFKIFNEDQGADVDLFAARATGRIAVGCTRFTEAEVYDPAKPAPFHLLQPLEFVGLFNSESIARVRKMYKTQVTGELLTKISGIVTENFWNEKFTAAGGYMITWEQQSLPSDVNKFNTFQAAIVTDGSKTFVVYNYEAVNFVTNPAGAGKSVAAGFARKSSYSMVTLPFRDAEVWRLRNVSGIGSGESGRFVYRVDTWPPVRGGCLTQDPTDAADRVLSSTVTRESVLGGSVTVVSGACHDGASEGKCSVQMAGKQIAEVPARPCPACGKVFLTCDLPASLREGRAELSMAVSGSANAYKAEIEFESPDEPIGPRVTLTEPEEWMKRERANLALTFDPALLNGTRTLEIVGYSEAGLTQLEEEASRPVLVKVLHKQELSDNSGSFDLSGTNCEGDDCDKYHVGYLQIKDNNNPRTTIRSKVIPLGWFVQKFYQGKGKFDSWFTDKCKAWSDSDNAAWKAVRDQLKTATCPCTLQLALSDTSRLLPLNYCPHLSGGCSTAKPEQQCFISRVASAPDLQGAPAAVCCYAKQHLLHQEVMNDRDSWHLQHGSTTFRSHPDGVPQSQTLLAGQVSYMSHWYWDTMQRLYCCRWSQTGTCPYFYMAQRPTPKCTGYKLGRSSSTVGDPHLKSYSGKPFLFNQFGEYWLLVSEEFRVQGRFVTEENLRNFTLLTAVAFRVGGDSSASFELNFAVSPPQIRRRQGDAPATLVPLAAGESHHEPGVTLLMKSNQQVIAQLSGTEGSVGIDLIAEASVPGFANLHLSLSDSMKDKTRGLLGRWTDNEANEFTTFGNVAVPYSTNWVEWNKDFCDKNRLTDRAHSLFNYEKASGFEEINNENQRRQSYKPIFDPSGLAAPGDEAAVCGSDDDCKFDYRVAQASGFANSRSLADSTKKMGQLFAQWQVTSNISVAYCDKPDIRGLAIGADDTLAAGTKLQLRCVSPLTISAANSETECKLQEDGSCSWEPQPSVTCSFDGRAQDEVAAANVGLIVGIVVGVLLLVAVVVAVVVIVMKGRKDSGSSPGKPPVSQQGSRDVIVNSDVERGVDNQGHGAAGRPPPDQRYSYQQSQQEPMDPADMNFTEYSDARQQPMQQQQQQQQQPQQQQPGHSEVV